MKLTLKETAKAVNALNDVSKYENIEITGAEFDSRKVKKGDLFIPLKGARDGHEFLEKARENGAVLSLWSKDVPTPDDFPVLIVEDVLSAFQVLAQYYLQKKKPTVIAITGSNGKTTTKDMTAFVLATTFKTYKTQGNYNNEIGMPYTILSMPEDTEKLVLEMGMDHAGDLHLLSTLATPDIAAITLIGESHLEFFGTREAIAKGKMEIADGLKENGLLIVPSDEPLLKSFLENISQEIATFGWDNSADEYVTVLAEKREETIFQFSFSEKIMEIAVPGKYNARNALVASMIARRLGVSMEDIAQALAAVELTRNRTEWVESSVGAKMLSDVYNANPTAMGLVLDSFSQMETTGKRRVVLGDMLELGEASKVLHESMSEHLDSYNIEKVYLFGKEMKVLFDKIVENFPKGAVVHFDKEDKQALIELLKNDLQKEDLLLLKASNGMGLFEVVEALK
ncbi:UDP-N-acetylmuramoyl-tripeptide--D-alanyl-D-alanine ligase [Pilibacter termitis]|uniref:UDP-N-acetylmuramoyl-tripeptide--D-alanyl-D-alanine ligase n=1 Tax=Pilibacter termitis TaxID=263852 RepID=A0A1T4RGT9_9ENTE|nr:UDP-N-acetylmuramoyl-tripeptide--D-alanyl-D-alanine ligase [Pilibacter termitis]SKA15153.1 UDP-N-acetylmuramoyl-tripeptide--D-alanyl-D-alanine ligase [Pilibacter termitis]